MNYAETIATVLRSPNRKAPAVIASPVPQPTPKQDAEEAPSRRGPMIEFVRRNGRTQAVYIRTNQAVKVLHITRDDDGNILSLSLNRSY
jgi:hypothetical protein